MSVKAIRGVREGTTIRDEQIVRDTRTRGAKIIDWHRIPRNMATTLFVLGAIAFLVPAVCDICLVLAVGLAAWGLTRKEELPLKMPVTSGKMDPHERHPATGKPSPANGIFFLGNELRTGREVWLTNSDCRQHFLVLGTTGAGKTEALLGFASNAVTWGSGFLYCDGKGDVSLFAKVYALARRFGREDDLLVLNFMTGNQDIGSSDGKLRSNTLNPFATGSSDTLTQMVVSLMDETGGDGAMWKGRATAMFTGVMRALTWLRDQGMIDLNVGEIRDHLNLNRIIDMADQNKYPDMPQAIRKSIRSYLTSLPGYQEEKHYKQAQTTLDQHGYLEMQFTKILGSLADVYGYIFKTPYGEIDMADVVLNRRILVVMLPALEKSSDEIANLGKIVVATLKGMMGGTLGSKIEGSWFEVVEQRPTTSPTPFICILDEVGYYMVDGMDLMAAQARSLGFSLVFAGQDINAMKRLNEKVFGSVQGNTNTKIIMRTEDPETAKIAIEAAGKAYIASGKNFDGEVGEVGKTYRDTMQAQIEQIDRINPLDLKAQDEGEMHILHKEWLVRAKSFYAAPESSLDKRALSLRTNHFITVAIPDRDEIEAHRKIPEIVRILADPECAARMKAEVANALAAAANGTDEISALAATFRELEQSKRSVASPVDAACVAFAKLLSGNRAVNDAYAKDVRSSFSAPVGTSPIADSLLGASRPPSRPQGRPMPSDIEDLGPFDGFAGGSFDLDDEDDDLPETRTPPKRPVSRPLGAGRLRKDVPHGAQFDNGELLDMADRIASNDSVMRTLAAFDFDPTLKTASEVDNAIEEALSGDPTNDRIPADNAPFDRRFVETADKAARRALPDYEDDFDDDLSGGATTEFLEALLLDDGDDDDDDRKD
jgi:Type IV secretory pathway, VirD4 components